MLENFIYRITCDSELERLERSMEALNRGKRESILVAVMTKTT